MSDYGSQVTESASVPVVFLPYEMWRLISDARRNETDEGLWLVGPPPAPWQKTEHRPLADLLTADPDALSPLSAEVMRPLLMLPHASGDDVVAVVGRGDAAQAAEMWSTPLAAVSRACLRIFNARIQGAASGHAPHQASGLDELVWWLEEHIDGFEDDPRPLDRDEERPPVPWGSWRGVYLRAGRGPQHDGEVATDRQLHSDDDPDRGLWLLGADLRPFELLHPERGEDEQARRRLADLRVARALSRIAWAGAVYAFSASSEIVGFDSAGRSLHGDPQPMLFIGDDVVAEARALCDAHDARARCAHAFPEIEPDLDEE